MIKKISGDAGHNCSPDYGMIGYKVEDVLTKEVWTYIKEEFSNLDVDVIDCTPYDMKYNLIADSLKYRVERANKFDSQLHLSIHFNSGESSGVECWIVKDGGVEQEYGEKITEELSKIGFKNRGVKIGNIFIIKETKMPAILIQCGFIDSEEDMKLYNGKKIARAIVKAIIGKNSEIKKIENEAKLKEILEENIKKHLENKENIKNKQEGFNLSYNGEIINSDLNVVDKKGNLLEEKIKKGTKVEILRVIYGLQLILLKYQDNGMIKTVYVKNNSNEINYFYKDKWENKKGREIIYEDSYCTKVSGYILQNEKATILSSKNGALNIVFDTKKGTLTKSAYVKYNGDFESVK
ncbi:MAG: N-acetylmuramoyl-L-alanine amidase [Sarcina sp.]